jgi:glycosyltransferase involved in cell wall biosynthesis
VPTAHDEPPIYLEIFRPLFHIPRFIVFLTDEERDFVHRHFQNPHVPWAVVGTGIGTPRDVSGERFRARYGLSEPFILYAGRISPSKNCNGLFEFFKRYKEETNASLKLVLIGRADMPIPEYADIVYLGFVREEDKFDGLQAAEVVVMPSRFESFSIVSLEALSVGTPVLVNGESLVLKEHCLRANGGLYYHSYEEFSLALTLLLEREDLRRRLGRQGAAYVSQFYPWSTIERRYLEILESVANGGEDWVR